MHPPSFQGYPEILQEWTENVSLALENADPNSWQWNRPEDVWGDADEEWQKFNDRWLGATAGLDIGSVLSIEHLNESFEQPTSILVRESYVWMFDHILGRAMSSSGTMGTVITGQPGTGKTLLLFYLLVRLLQMRQVVLFSPRGDQTYLFYGQKVYLTSVASTALGPAQVANRLPIPTSLSSDVFIWSLFDIQAELEPKDFFLVRPCLPVQTASLNPVRYKNWSKHQQPLLAGLPLWSRDELVQGLKLQNSYKSLLVALDGGSSQNQRDSLERFPGACALLEELQECRKDDESSSPPETMLLLNAPVSPSPEEAVDYLLDAAIEHFGYSARDVYAAVFNYTRSTKSHQDAFNISCSQLKEAVSAILHNQSADFKISNFIIAIRPQYLDQPLVGVLWAADFKSDWIFRSVLLALGKVKDTDIRKFISHFRNMPLAQDFVGRFLEPLAHRSIAESTDGFWPLFNMVSDDADPPHFTLKRSSPAAVTFAKVKREIVIFANVDISTCLQAGVYYMPEDPNFPLFDAFTIDLDQSKKSAVLWVLQITTSRSHGGSERGYLMVRKIVASLKNMLVEDQQPPQKSMKTTAEQSPSTPKVQVRYLLVVPNGTNDLEWRFPKGWNQRNNHRGDVYCLQVPGLVCDF